MAIMAMDMVSNINKKFICLALLVSLKAQAGEWTFTPNLGFDETYSNNVELQVIDPQSSFVSQMIAGLNADYKSKSANVTFSGTKSFLNYSHDSELNDDYRTLNTNGSLALWSEGPVLIASASIANVSRNDADNSFSDIISGDTVESENYNVGLQYNIGNTLYSLQSSLMYNETKTEDNIGENAGYFVYLNGKNGSSARNVFWQLSSSYSSREQDAFNPQANNSDGEHYIVDAQIGAITPWAFNPFIRFYDEDVSGTAAGNSMATTSSWGPGLRWLASQHIIIDLSYNYVADETVSEDYIAANINWQPSGRTSLIAGYNKRFFGDSYNFDFKHKTRRITNKISYTESLEVFDRSNYQEATSEFWCPSESFEGNPNDCFPVNQPPDNQDDYQLIPVSSLVLVENNEYSLNKRLSWTSILQLSRTTFTLNLATNNREGLESNIFDDYYDANLTINRKISPRSNLAISGSFRHNIFDKNNPEGIRQEDYYRTVSGSYSINLASSLLSSFTLRYIDRDSTEARYSYDEIRASLHITKDF
ncbi:MAG: TIGR03016 family PEP-CTERM system-associated outer membrane protein [Colwellia sp.]|nr:TIGR03016 family PEP-CTERM system-associated outer membrane protein [Colwellia sp.]